MKFTKTLVATALVATAGMAQAELTANIGAHSKYIFRGIDLNGGAAVSGGLDYDSGAGFYAGTWISDAGLVGTEMDLYAGFAGEMGSIGYDVNALYFAYPASGGDGAGADIDYLEVSLGLSMGPATATIAYTPWEERGDSTDAAYGKGDMYYSLGVDLPGDIDGFTFSAVVGYYDFDDDGSVATGDISYKHWGASVSKDVGDMGAISLSYDETDQDDDDFGLTATPGDALFTVGWTKEF